MSSSSSFSFPLNTRCPFPWYGDTRVDGCHDTIADAGPHTTHHETKDTGGAKGKGATGAKRRGWAGVRVGQAKARVAVGVGVGGSGHCNSVICSCRGFHLSGVLRNMAFHWYADVT